MLTVKNPTQLGYLYSFCASTLFRGSGGKNFVKCFWGFMLSPIFKLLTKRLRKGQVSLNQLARIVRWQPKHIVSIFASQEKLNILKLEITVKTLFQLFFKVVVSVRQRRCSPVWSGQFKETVTGNSSWICKNYILFSLVIRPLIHDLLRRGWETCSLTQTWKKRKHYLLEWWRSSINLRSSYFVQV